MRQPRFSAYGLDVESRCDLPVTASTIAADSERRLRVRLASAEDVGERWSGAQWAPQWQTIFPNDCHVRCELGRGGDHLLTFGRRASFHLDRRGQTLRCAPAAAERLDWRRFLLETALPCVSSIRGLEALHASAVRTPAGVVAFVAVGGGGKSTIAAELVSRGHDLVCDDVLTVSRDGARILGHPGPPLLSLAAGAVADPGMGERVDDPGEDGTLWIRVNRCVSGPEPLAAIFILERHRPHGAQTVPEPSRPGRLAPHTLSLDRDPGRALSRLGLLREIAATVSVHRVGAPDGEVAEVADTIEATLAEELTSAVETAGHASAA